MESKKILLAIGIPVLSVLFLFAFLPHIQTDTTSSSISQTISAGLAESPNFKTYGCFYTDIVVEYSDNGEPLEYERVDLGCDGNVVVDDGLTELQNILSGQITGAKNTNFTVLSLCDNAGTNKCGTPAADQTESSAEFLNTTCGLNNFSASYTTNGTQPGSGVAYNIYGTFTNSCNNKHTIVNVTRLRNTNQVNLSAIEFSNTNISGDGFKVTINITPHFKSG